jgi:5-methylcytosine-specific restriction endonuclease McrA
MARHPSKIRWDVENKERLAELKANWYKKNKQRLKEKRLLCIEEQREKWRANTHNKRARKRANGGVITPGIDKKLFSLQRGKCACCEKDISCGYHIDHIMPTALGGINGDKNLQLLCPQCNMKKGAKHPVDFMQSIGFLL